MKKQESIGSRLIKAREARNLAIDDIYKNLRIHPRVIDALEKNDSLDIGEVYIKGFLRKYADYLGVDINVSKVLPKIAEEPIIKEPTRINTPQILIKDRFKRSILPLTALLAVVFVIFIIGHAGARLIGVFKNLGSALPKAQVAAVDTTQKPGLSLPIPMGETLTLGIITNDQAWLRVKSDGKIIFEHTLPKGSEESWTADESFELWVGRAEALDFTLNDIKLSSPGRGRIKKLVVDHKGLHIEKK